MRQPCFLHANRLFTRDEVVRALVGACPRLEGLSDVSQAADIEMQYTIQQGINSRHIDERDAHITLKQLHLYSGLIFSKERDLEQFWRPIVDKALLEGGVRGVPSLLVREVFRDSTSRRGALEWLSQFDMRKKFSMGARVFFEPSRVENDPNGEIVSNQQDEGHELTWFEGVDDGVAKLEEGRVDEGGGGRTVPDGAGTSTAGEEVGGGAKPPQPSESGDAKLPRVRDDPVGQGDNAGMYAAEEEAWRDNKNAKGKGTRVAVDASRDVVCALQHCATVEEVRACLHGMHQRKSSKVSPAATPTSDVTSNGGVSTVHRSLDPEFDADVVAECVQILSSPEALSNYRTDLSTRLRVQEEKEDSGEEDKVEERVDDDVDSEAGSGADVVSHHDV